jgi:Domain of unknown function (DUF4333)
VVAVLVVVGATDHLDMVRVQSSVRSLLQTQVQPRSGILSDLRVTCPGSEPKQAGRVFDCKIVVTETGAQFTAVVRETDSKGDLLVEQVAGIGPVEAIPPTTSPASIVGSRITGQLLSGQSTIIVADVAQKSLSVDSNRQR